MSGDWQSKSRASGSEWARIDVLTVLTGGQYMTEDVPGHVLTKRYKAMRVFALEGDLTVALCKHAELLIPAMVTDAV